MVEYMPNVLSVIESRSHYGMFYLVQSRSLCFWLGADGEA
jgi:hypothetical protein